MKKTSESLEEITFDKEHWAPNDPNKDKTFSEVLSKSQKNVAGREHIIKRDAVIKKIFEKLGEEAENLEVLKKESNWLSNDFERIFEGDLTGIRTKVFYDKIGSGVNSLQIKPIDVGKGNSIKFYSVRNFPENFLKYKINATTEKNRNELDRIFQEILKGLNCYKDEDEFDWVSKYVERGAILPYRFSGTYYEPLGEKEKLKRKKVYKTGERECVPCVGKEFEYDCNSCKKYYANEDGEIKLGDIQGKFFKLKTREEIKELIEVD